MARIIALTKNGANGTWLFIVFLFSAKSITLITEPIKKERVRVIKIFGKPVTKPAKKARYASPIPIHFSLDTETRIKKNKKAISPPISPENIERFQIPTTELKLSQSEKREKRIDQPKAIQKIIIGISKKL